MTWVIVCLYLISAVLGLYVAFKTVRIVLNLGPRYGGFHALAADSLKPREAWRLYAITALAIVSGTAAGILSVV